jgi:hypothetical protein
MHRTRSVESCPISVRAWLFAGHAHFFFNDARGLSNGSADDCSWQRQPRVHVSSRRAFAEAELRPSLTANLARFRYSRGVRRMELSRHNDTPNAVQRRIAHRSRAFPAS